MRAESIFLCFEWSKHQKKAVYLQAEKKTFERKPRLSLPAVVTIIMKKRIKNNKITTKSKCRTKGLSAPLLSFWY